MVTVPVRVFFFPSIRGQKRKSAYLWLIAPVASRVLEEWRTCKG